MRDYTHKELEGDEIGTQFFSEGWEGRLELIQPNRNGWQGAVGVQALKRDFEAEGGGGLRAADQDRRSSASSPCNASTAKAGASKAAAPRDPRAGQHRRRSGLHRHLRVVGRLHPAADGWFFALSGSRTERAPSQEELFADGPHPATRAYERGDTDLDSEVSYSLDLTGHYGAGAWDVDAHLFAAKYEGFIDLRPTGEEDEDSHLPIHQFVQTDATFYGAELEGSYRLWEDGARSFRLEASADYVHGDTDLGALARIPPWSAAGRGVFEGGWWTGQLEVRRVGEQDRVAEFELPTDGYTMLNASLTFRPLKDQDFKVFVEGRNLTDVEAREHASFLKDIAPLPGRNLRVGVGYRF